MDRDAPPSTFRDVMSNDAGLEQVRDLLAMHRPLASSGHRPWRIVRHLARGAGLDARTLWRAVKWLRLSTWREVGLAMPDGRPFGFCVAPWLLESLHRIDRATGGGGPTAAGSPDGLLAHEGHRVRLRMKTLMDEAAESSLIEGAATTRREAVDMLRSARAPRTRGERMVFNNYQAMQRLKGWASEPLSAAMLLELQAVLTDGTLDEEGVAGRFRGPGEPVRVVDQRTGEDVHTPPPAALLRERIDRLCDFANRDHRGDDFIHPIVKASMLHFFIGYEHPFVDGNGRTARAVFYWHALRHGYSVLEYIPISERIRRGYARYPQAYVDTEHDDGDLTYFVQYKLGIVEQSLDGLSEHLAREVERVRRSEGLLRVSRGLNMRQRILLEHALRRPMQRYTVKSHANTNGVVRNTARADLEGLAKLRLLVPEKDGREVVYRPAPTLLERVERAMPRP